MVEDIVKKLHYHCKHLVYFLYRYLTLDWTNHDYYLYNIVLLNKAAEAVNMLVYVL